METTIQPVFNPDRPADIIDYLDGYLPFENKAMSGYAAGEATMSLKGHGYELRNVRDYIYGDDVRKVDWAATARQPNGRLQIKEFDREIKPNFVLISDVAQSSYESVISPDAYYSERDLAIGACLGLLQLASRQGMPSATITANDERILESDRYGRGQSHLADLADHYAGAITPNGNLERLLSATSATRLTRPRLADVIQYAAEHVSHSLVAVVSDFRDSKPGGEQADWNKHLQHLRDRDNQIIALTVTNPADFKLPEQHSRFATEQGVIYVSKGRDGQKQRKQYEASSRLNAEAIGQALSAVDAHRIELSTADSDWINSLQNQL